MWSLTKALNPHRYNDAENHLKWVDIKTMDPLPSEKEHHLMTTLKADYRAGWLNDEVSISPVLTGWCPPFHDSEISNTSVDQPLPPTFGGK